MVASQNRNRNDPMARLHGRCCCCRWRRFAPESCAINSAKMAAAPKWRLGRCPSSSSLPFVVLCLLSFCVACGAASNIPDVTNWVVRFGREIFEYSRSGSYFDEIQKGYNNAHRRVVKKDGHEMVREMTTDMETMVAGKINAVKRITETVEQVMMGHEYDPYLGETFQYNNAKMLNKPGGPSIVMVKNEHFYNMPVNTSNSSIHVPINVYANAPEVVNAIKWSGHLNYIFESNYLLDPSLSWQYFGSSTGFLRQYPAIEWKSETKADTYDCRMRSWYIQAATSPKDMVIMIDNSGSMTGLRKEIAKHVALNILDTLADDDHFNIFMFNNTIKCLVDCYNDSLVPASMENIREYKLKFKHTDTKEIANFTLALITAFELLAKYNNTDSKEGNRCNQAIMLITDGASDKYENIFRRYNDPERRVRVFTYFIGQEMSDVHEVEAIACNNRGYYSHVSTIAEARDQVQKYVPVMSRPLVLHQENTTIWTSIYADITDPKMSDWRWESKEKERNKERVKRAYEGDKSFNDTLSEYERCEMEYAKEEIDVDQLKRQEDSDIVDGNGVKLYRLMTTVASPAFDRTKYTKVRADLLGVAGIDVPIEEITKLAPPHKLGVNGYSFAITNNGYVIFHPDLRPVYADSLKPDYNSVDLSEVELRNDNLDPRVFDDELLTLRAKMIDRETNTSKMTVKMHMDKMKRVTIRKYVYYYAPIRGTPFSFGIALPEDYGIYKVLGEIDLRNNSININTLFEDSKWKVHPNWIYCAYVHPNASRETMNPEERLKHFLDKVTLSGYKWGTTRVRQPPTESEYRYKNVVQLDKNKIYCDTELLQSLIFDAEATKLVGKHVKSDKIEQETSRNHGITMSFVATRSGLTRWDEYNTEENSSIAEEFINKNNTAIDEIWYKRAVDYNFHNREAFIFSVPFRSEHPNKSEDDTYVIGTRTVYLENRSRRDMIAPAAVAGLQFKHSVFSAKFFNITSDFTSHCNCSCSNETLDCYLLDDHGFVVVSERPEHTGKFLGEVDGMLMDVLVKVDIYLKVPMTDYQAICFDVKNVTNSGSILFTPIRMAQLVFTWVWSKLTTLYIHAQLADWWSWDFYALGCLDQKDSEQIKLPPTIRKRTPRLCDERYFLYQLQGNQFNGTQRNISLSNCSRMTPSCKSFLAASLVPYTNLLLLVVDTTCPCDWKRTSLRRTEIRYNDTQTCQIHKSNIYRSKPSHCVSYHPLELEIKECGAGSCAIAADVAVLTAAVSLLVATSRNS